MRKLVLVISLALAFGGAGALARERIDTGPYGMVLDDLLSAFHAVETVCEDGSTEASEVCFAVASVGVSYLAELVTALVEAYAPAGLSQGAWRSGNGVWAVSLTFRKDGYGHLELYLTETLGSGVRGLVRLVQR